MKKHMRKPTTAELTGQIITDSVLSFLNYMPNPDDVASGTWDSYNTYRKMRTDPRVKSLLSKIKSAALNFPCHIVQEDADNRVYDFIGKIDLFKNLYKKQRRMLTALDYGFSVSELIWKREGGGFVPENIITRKPERFSFDSNWNLYNQDIGSRSLLNQSYKWLIYQHDPDDENPYGTSMLRCVYWPWMFKQAGYDFWLQATEKFAVKSLYALFDSDGDEEKVRSRAMSIAEMLMGIESGSTAAIGNVKEIKDIGMSGDLSSFKEMVEACDIQISYGLTGQSIATSNTNGGSLALGEVQADLLYEDCKGIALELQNVLQHVIDWTVELNFGPGVAAPQIVFDVERRASFEQVIQAIDRNIPVSKSALYSQYGLPEPKDEEDSFVMPAGNQMMLSDTGKSESVKKKLFLYLSEDSSIREERNRAREIDSLSDAAKKAINPYLNKVVKDFLTLIKDKENQLKNVKKEDYGSVFPEETADAVAATAEGYVHAVEQLIASSYMLGMIHADEEKPRNGKSITAADEAPEEIPAITFEKAKEFLKSKIPMTKSEWLKLEPKLRFRAFTVAKLGQAELIDRVKKELVKSIQSGTGVAQTWDEFKKLAEKSIDNFSPWYWETVFRTNTQSAYIAGKLQRYEGTGAKAYQLMVIDDSRTTDICRNLLRQSGYGMVLPVEHQFWKKYGFPPYHFNCRTSVRAVYSSQIGGRSGQKLDNIKMSGFENFKPQEGFGGNPVDKESWWKMTESMKAQAEAFGLWGNILQQAYDMDMLNYQKELLQGYDLKYKGKKGGYVEAAKNWEYSEKEMTAAKIMADKGHTVYLLPKSYLDKIKNPDILIDNQIGEIKQLKRGTQTAVDNEVRDAAHQKARIVFLQIPDTDIPLKTLIETAKNRQKRSGIIKKILVYFQGVLSDI